MPSCYDKDFYHRITCIVSYSGSTADLFLNYAVLFINICACWNIHQRQSGDTVRRQRQRQRQRQRDYQSLNRQQQQQGRSSPTDGTGRQVAAAAAAAATNMTKSQAALASLLFVVVFQVTLCLVLGCTGISIVWCACMPWLFLERNDSRSNDNNNNTTTVILMLDVSVILYYAVVAPLITTVAHMCAIILGLVLWIFSSFLTTTPTNVQNLRESM